MTAHTVVNATPVPRHVSSTRVHSRMAAAAAVVETATATETATETATDQGRGRGQVPDRDQDLRGRVQSSLARPVAIAQMCARATHLAIFAGGTEPQLSDIILLYKKAEASVLLVVVLQVTLARVLGYYMLLPSTLG